MIMALTNKLAPIVEEDMKEHFICVKCQTVIHPRPVPFCAKCLHSILSNKGHEDGSAAPALTTARPKKIKSVPRTPRVGGLRRVRGYSNLKKALF